MGKKDKVITGPALKILVVKAIGLPAADIGGTSDPYVQIQVGYDYNWNPKVWKTGVINKNLNPIWNQEFVVPVASPEKDSVRLAVFDHDFIGSDDLLGQVVFPGLHKLQMGVPTEAILNLAGVNSSRGTIHVVFTAMNFGVQPTQVVVQQNVVAPPPTQVVQQTTTTTAHNPYGAPAPNPYGAPAANPYGAPAANPYGAPAPNPYGAPAPNPYGAPAPASNPYGAPAANPYGAPAPNPYGAPGY